MKKENEKLFLWIFVGISIFSLVFMGFVSSFKIVKKEYQLSLRESDHFLGDPKKAKIIVYEYSDFECPACKAFVSIIKGLKEKYKDKIVVVYRHFPLTEIHPNALVASQAAEAAGKQGKFWEMHDILFLRQDEWKSLSNPKETFIKYAQELKLDTKKFIEDFESEEIKNKILEERKEALGFGLNGTPSFFVNNRLVNLTSFDSLEEEIKKEFKNINTKK